MSGELPVVETPPASMACRLVHLNDSVLKVDVDEVIECRVGRPLDESWFWTVHDEDRRLR